MVLAEGRFVPAIRTIPHEHTDILYLVQYPGTVYQDALLSFAPFVANHNINNVEFYFGQGSTKTEAVEFSKACGTHATTYLRR